MTHRTMSGCSTTELDLAPIRNEFFISISMVRGFANGAMGRWIDHSWGGPIELFFVPASAPRLV